MNERFFWRASVLAVLWFLPAGLLLCPVRADEIGPLAQADSSTEDVLNILTGQSSGSASAPTAANGETAETSDKDVSTAQAPGEVEELPPRAEIVRALDGTLVMHVQNTDVRVVLKHLSNEFRKSVVFSRDVAGKVNLDLFGASFDEAFDALVRAAGLIGVRKDGVYFVYTQTEKEALDKAEKRLTVRVFRLAYLTDSDGKRRPVTGGSVSGNIRDVQARMYLSREIQSSAGFQGPLSILLPEISVSGAAST